MTSRMNREQFFGQLEGLDREDLAKVLWTLYWRGPGQTRERIAELLDPELKAQRTRAAAQAPNADAILAEVKEFAALARAGAYLGRDRRVSPTERTRWRFTFRRLATEAQKALRGRGAAAAVEALSVLVDLARGSRDVEYFRSEDPIEAARFVVSDAVASIWAWLRDQYGANHMAEQAATHLVRWESNHGWTRMGFGWVAEHESSLASTLAGFLTVPDLWTTAAGHYLEALDRIEKSGTKRERSSTSARQRADDLREWHALLVERLVGSDDEGLLDQLVEHPALAGPELLFVQARLAHRRGDLAGARRLIARCLKSLPGHPEFRDFAAELGGA